MRIEIPEWEEPRGASPVTEEDIRNSNNGGLSTVLRVGDRIEFPDQITADDFRFSQSRPGATKSLLCKAIKNGQYSWIGVATFRRRPVDFNIHLRKWPDMLRLAEIDNDWDRMQSLAGKTVMVVSSEEMDFHTLNQDGTTAVRRALFCVFELQPTRQEREEANRRAEMEISNRLPKKTVTSHVYSPIGTTAKNDMSISKPTHQRDTSQSATLNEFASKFGDLYDVHTTFSPSRIDQLSRLSNRELAKECGRVVTKYLKQQNAQAIQGKSPGVKMLVTGVTTFGRLVTRGGTLRTIRERLDCGAVSREEVIIQIINHSMLLTNK